MKTSRNPEPLDPRLLAADGARYFTYEALREAQARSQERSRETLVLMHPRDFLAMAYPAQDEQKTEGVARLMASRTAFRDVPYLLTNRPDAKKPLEQVHGHEGRHRARALLAQGVTEMPVLLSTGNIRWSAQDDPANRDYLRVWPTVLRSETKRKSIPFPKSLFWDRVEANPSRRKNPSDEDEFDADYWDEEMQELCEGVDYALLQEEEDARRFDRRGGRGYHDTSPERAEAIKREGLGSHPGLTYHGGGGIEPHEVEFWMCAWAHPDFAAQMLAKGRKGRWSEYTSRLVADELSEHLVKRHPDLKVVWFYADAEGGGISKYGGARCSFNLRKVVDWLSDNAEDGPYLFGNEDMGYCLSWDGPRIPPTFLRWEQSNPRRAVPRRSVPRRAVPRRAMPRRNNGFLAALALVGIGMAAGVYVEEKKGVAAKVRGALKGKDKTAREQFDRLKRTVLEAQPARREAPRAQLALRTSTPIAVRSSVLQGVTDPAWVRERSPDDKGYSHTRRIAGTEYVVFERIYGNGDKAVILDALDASGRGARRIPGGEGLLNEEWKNVAAAKKAAEKLAQVSAA